APLCSDMLPLPSRNAPDQMACADRFMSSPCVAGRLPRPVCAGAGGRARRTGKGPSGRERGTAAAGGVRVGVADDELGAFQALAVVDLGTGEVLEAHRVDQQLHALVLDHGVAFLHGLVEL